MKPSKWAKLPPCNACGSKRAPRHRAMLNTSVYVCNSEVRCKIRQKEGRVPDG